MNQFIADTVRVYAMGETDRFEVDVESLTYTDGTKVRRDSLRPGAFLDERGDDPEERFRRVALPHPVRIAEVAPPEIAGSATRPFAAGF